MKYLIVSCTLFDAGGLSMINGAINGLKSLDRNAVFASLHAPEHNKDGIMQIFIEPKQNEDAFKWADIILDIGGLCDNQPNKYEWLLLRKKYNKPYIWMSQSFMNVTSELLDGTFVVCRGQRATDYVKEIKSNCEIFTAPDLSFLLTPIKWEGKQYKRVFSTNIMRDLRQMYDICNKETDIQIIEKSFNNREWEEKLPINSFCGTPEENYGLVESVQEVFASRYHIACASILSGKKPTIYFTDNEIYNRKYYDLLDYYGCSKEELINKAMLSCNIAWEVINGTKRSIN